jgi:small subunit ribosomal protein S5
MLLEKQELNFKMENFQKNKQEKKLIERVIKIRRVAKVVKGGRRFGFSALTVVGDGNGSVGIGSGKALELAESVKKSLRIATKSMKSYNLYKNTIPHEVQGLFCGGKVLLKPTPPGNGVIANDSARAVIEAIGIKDINVKALGSRNAYNVVKAVLAGLSQLRTFDKTAELRGKDIKEVCVLDY